MKYLWGWKCWALMLSPFYLLCSSSAEDLILTIRNYLDVDAEAKVNFTLSDKNSRATHHLPAKYLEDASVSIKQQEVYVWNVSFTIDKEKNRHYVPDEVIITEPRNFSITVYGLPNTSKALMKFTEESPSHGKLGIDQALLQLTNYCPYPVDYSELSENCYKCLGRQIGTLVPGDTALVIVSTQFRMTYLFESETSVCRSVSNHFEEHKRYSFNITRDPKDSCSDDLIVNEERQEPQNAYMPILYVGIVLIGSFLIWTVYTKTYTCMKSKGLCHFRRIDRTFSKDMGDPDGTVQKEYGTVNKSEEDRLLASTSETASVNNETPPAKKRLRSLDTVRGLSLMIMIFVNYGGGGYWFFAHSKWNGVTVADLVFPWFVWIMGVSIVFSFRSRRKTSFISCLYQIIRRSIILLGLGLFLNNGFVLSKWRIPGVLQRFAASYFVVALTELLTVRYCSRLTFQSVEGVLKHFQDILSNWIHWVIIVALELVWLSLTFGLKVPGCPRGYIGPGGLSEGGKYANCTGGAAAYIDRKILSEAHIYHHPTCKELYQTGPFDPEGILGTLNSIVICFLGVQAGRIISCHKRHHSRLLRFVLWGVILGGIATILCEGKKNGGFIPLNKNLWSLSFILAMAGLGYILLAAFYFLIDVVEVWNGAPFVYPGMNSILVYVGSELLEGMFPFGWHGMENSHFQFLTSNVISILTWTLIAYYWYTIDFFVKI